MMPMIPSRPVGPVRRVSRKAWPTAVSRHARTSALSAISAPRTCGETTQAASRAGDWIVTSMSATQQHDERRDQEERRELPPSVEQLAESGEDGRQARRGEAANVRRPRVGPDPAGLHSGLWLLCRCWGDSGVASESTRLAAGHGDAGRSISLP